jgi:two-component system, chemotaxis family, chemotaxis protein CheY
MMVDYNLERLQFLIVDDNKHMRALVKTILNALGVRHYLEATDGAAALKELRHFPADIIICDWKMDPLDGVEFVKMVRTSDDSPNPFVPIIMLTGHTELSKVMEARDVGVHEFLAKPISAKKLYARIRAIIEHPRSFVRTKGMNSYFGPDRRRKQSPLYKGKERRKKEAKLLSEDGPLAGEEKQLSQDELDALLNG